MSKKELTLVYYHIPEDKDDPDCPNVFGVPQGKANLKLAHIHEAFPLKGTYLFRFKTNHEGQTVWLDLPDVNAKLPTFKERVQMKATRVSWDEAPLHSFYRQKHQKGSVKEEVLAPPVKKQPQPAPSMLDLEPKVENNKPARIDMLDMSPQKSNGIHATGNGFDMLSMGVKTNSQTQSKPVNGSGLDFFDQKPNPVPNKPASNGLNGGMDLLGGHSHNPGQLI